MTERAQALEAALRGVEWIKVWSAVGDKDEMYETCPACCVDRALRGGHTAWCPLDKTLKLAVQPPPPVGSQTTATDDEVLDAAARHFSAMEWHFDREYQRRRLDALRDEMRMPKSTSVEPAGSPTTRPSREVPDLAKALLKSLEPSVEPAGASEPPSEAAQAHAYLSRLLVHAAPQCEPLQDLMGLCTQIDTLLTGLQGEPEPCVWRESANGVQTTCGVKKPLREALHTHCGYCGHPLTVER